jgi:Domain of unknown function (DUF1830)
MNSESNPVLASLPDCILCYYVNTTNQMQRARISNIPNWIFERIVFPRQRFLFEARPEALLEIHTCSYLGETLLNRIPCLRLRVNEKILVSTALSQAPDSAPLVN